MHKIIFFGNGPLADAALAVLSHECQVIYHARTKDDLAEATRLKRENREAFGVLASFGVLIKSDVLEAFEPEGILNIHPSLLPKYRGASPIESAILDGDTEFSVSVMKLVRAMDAGPIYYQKTFAGTKIAEMTAVPEAMPGLPASKIAIYDVLANAGAKWLVSHLVNLTNPTDQNDADATFCGKFEKRDGLLDPASESRVQILRKIIAFQGFPKPKCAVCGKNCTILAAHIPEQGTTAPLELECQDAPLVIDRLQPDGGKPMDARAFLNGYGKR